MTIINTRISSVVVGATLAVGLLGLAGCAATTDMTENDLLGKGKVQIQELEKRGFTDVQYAGSQLLLKNSYNQFWVTAGHCRARVEFVAKTSAIYLALTPEGSKDGEIIVEEPQLSSLVTDQRFSYCFAEE